MNWQTESGNFILRKAELNDIQLLFTWANDSEVRLQAFHQEPIVWEKHEAWFTRKMASPDTEIYILEKDSIPVGQIRFDFDALENGWVIDYSVEHGSRGKGIGKLLVSSGISMLNKKPVIALVKNANLPSAKIFEQLDFTMTADQDIHSPVKKFKLR
jgi:RimJ/RimL family protein N-acetyltransferase